MNFLYLYAKNVTANAVIQFSQLYLKKSEKVRKFIGLFMLCKLKAYLSDKKGTINDLGEIKSE